MFVERLQEYRKRMGRLPRRIIVFRVGGTEKIAGRISLTETQLIRSSFRAVEDHYSPLLTYLVCGNSRMEKSSNQAEVAGDTFTTSRATDDRLYGICGSDFFLKSRVGQMSSDAAQFVTRYSLLSDENNFDVGDLQRGINSLCYLWERTTRSANMVAPARCAMQASHHAKTYVYRMRLALSPEDQKKVWDRLMDESVKGFVHEKLKAAMFYM